MRHFGLSGGIDDAFPRLFRKQPVVSRVSDIEYRTWAATSHAEAKAAAQRLLRLRLTAWRRRRDTGWAAGQPR